ncbi:MAG: MBL fold metallo-hydrolase [Sphingobium sp.]|nr:MBL fold metallo-hydrolase [Sphingobium sp.]MCP5399585.1 MBL fold metallo-hydrolase [Sphingomonas sp.]
MMRSMVKWVGGLLLWAAVAVMLVVTFVPAFLDRIYYRGPHSDHFDGAHFSNPDGEITFTVPPGQRRGNLFYRFLFGRDDRPPWPEHVTVRQSRPPAHVAEGEMRATWVGHATVLVQAGGLNILTDPQWSDYASPFPGIGPKRVAAPGIAFDDLPKIDIVVVSHNHYDHMDLPTLKRLWERDKPLIVTSLGNDRVIAQAGVEARALDWGGVAEAGGAKVHVIRNHHWSSRWAKDRNRALWSAFVIETEAGNIFFAGDTGMGDGKWPLEARSYGPVRLAIIPIGAFRFYPGQMETGSHIGPRQAVEMFKMLGAAQGVPIHWGTFRLSSEARDTPPKMQQLYMRCSGLDPASFRPLDIGEAIDVSSAASPGQAVSAQARADCKPGSAALDALK